MTDVSIILPSYKPDEKLKKTVTDLEEAGFYDIIVVDDGGGSEYNHFFDELRERESCTVLVHPENRGKGAALKTAFKWYTENRNGIGVVTVDGDGQHFPKDVSACCEKLSETGKTVLGVRDFSLPDVPARSRFGNKLTSGIFRTLVGLRCSDTQTGLRAFPADILPLLLKISGDRYEYETNMLLYMKRFGLEFSEVKITTVYINENETSHFRPVRDSIRIYSLIFKFLFTSTFVKFLGSSLVCYLIDISLFTAFGYLCVGAESDVLKIGVPYLCARLLSSLFNYYLNRKVFKASGASTKETLLKYYALAICILLVGSVGVTYAVKGIAAIPAVGAKFVTKAQKTFLNDLIKIPVDCILYIVSYNVQKKHIFKA